MGNAPEAPKREWIRWRVDAEEQIEPDAEHVDDDDDEVNDLAEDLAEDLEDWNPNPMADAHPVHPYLARIHELMAIAAGPPEELPAPLAARARAALRNPTLCRNGRCDRGEGVVCPHLCVELCGCAMKLGQRAVPCFQVVSFPIDKFPALPAIEGGAGVHSLYYARFIAANGTKVHYYRLEDRGLRIITGRFDIGFMAPSFALFFDYWADNDVVRQEAQEVPVEGAWEILAMGQHHYVFCQP